MKMLCFFLQERKKFCWLEFEIPFYGWANPTSVGSSTHPSPKSCFHGFPSSKKQDRPSCQLDAPCPEFWITTWVTGRNSLLLCHLHLNKVLPCSTHMHACQYLRKWSLVRSSGSSNTEVLWPVGTGNWRRLQRSSPLSSAGILSKTLHGCLKATDSTEPYRQHFSYAYIPMIRVNL